MDDQDLLAAAAAATFDLLDDAIAVVTVDADGLYPVALANAALGRMVGQDAAELAGRPLSELYPSAVVAGFTRQVDEALRTGQPIHQQIDHQAPAGRTTLDRSLCPMPSTDGQPPRVAVVLRDVTPLVRVNDTLDEVERVTRTGTWTWEVTSDTVRWSSQLYELFGLTRDRMEPSFAGYLQRVHPDDRADVEAAVQDTFATGRPFEMHHRVVMPDGHDRWLHCTGRRVDGLDGAPVRMSGTARLVDDRDPAAGRPTP